MKNKSKKSFELYGAINNGKSRMRTIKSGDDTLKNDDTSSLVALDKDFKKNDTFPVFSKLHRMKLRTQTGKRFDLLFAMYNSFSTSKRRHIAISCLWLSSFKILITFLN